MLLNCFCFVFFGILIFKVLRKRQEKYGWEESDEPKPCQVTSGCYLKSSTIGTQTLEDLSLTSSEDTLDPSPIPEAASTETARNCRSHAKLGSEADSSFCTPATSVKLVLLSI